MRPFEKLAIAAAAVMLLGPAACAKKPATTSATTARGRDYTVPIPAGFSADPDVPVPAGVVALFQIQRTAPDWFRGSIVITPIPPSEPPFDPASATLCKEVLVELAKAQKVTGKSAAIIDGPFGKTCRYEVESPTSKQAAIGTIVKGPKSMWMLTCNHDPRDTKTVEECDKVLRAFKFDDPK